MLKIEQRIDRALSRCVPDSIVRVVLDGADFRALMAVAVDNLAVSLAPGSKVSPRYRDLPIMRTTIGSSHLLGRRLGAAARLGPVLI